MAITAEQVESSNTLEEFRKEFNSLQSDVSGLEAGTIAFTTIETTNANTTTLNVLEDGTIKFEGATDDSFETTLTAADPTAARTITFPDASGTVSLSTGSGSFSVADGGTIGSTTTGGAITIAANGDITLSGDLTVSGDDLTMGTNTSGHLLIADGTNFNPTAVGDLSEISTVANDDVFLAVDTSGGGLKRIARSAVVAGLATSSAISNVVEDTTPQLGGDLDVVTHDIVSTSNRNISLLPNGSGKVVLDGNGSSGGISISDGTIDIRTGTGSEAKILFYCESSNAHAQTLQAQPHSAGVTNTLLLPAGSSSTLVSLVSTDTLTNKTLTSPVINTGTFGTSILPTSADGTTLGSASKEFSDLFLADAGTIQFGNDQEVTLTHVADVGLTLTHTGSGDNLPIVLQLKSEEDAIIANEVIASLEFAAGDSDGTDGATVAAGIHAIAEGTFSATANATKLVFTTGVSETAASSATAKMTLSSAGLLTIADDFMIKDGGTIGVASTNDAMTISSAGIVTFKDDIVIKDGGTFGTSTTPAAMTIASGGAVTFSATPVFPDGSIALDDLDIDGGTDIGADLTTSDLIVVDDAAGGTNRKAALSRVVTLMTAQGFSQEDPTALAIALG
jgi:hypothetical protein